MPSLATWTSSYLTPVFLQTGASSSGLIGREASEMSVSPAQNFSKPPPVPDLPTRDLDVGVLLVEQLGRGLANGQTVDEPSMRDLALEVAAADADALPPPLELLVVVAAACGDAERQRAATASASRKSVDSHRPFLRRS